MQADYSLISQLLASSAPGVSPAGLHGALTGYLCSGAAPDIDVFDDLFELALPGVVRQLLERLGTETLGELQQSDYVFQPLLPSDESALAERLLALSHWCDWFNIGFSAGYMQPQTPLPVDVMEILNDFGQLAEVEAAADGALQAEEEDESYFVELVEFVRMAAITVYQQLQELAPAEPGVEEPEQLFADRDDDHFLH